MGDWADNALRGTYGKEVERVANSRDKWVPASTEGSRRSMASNRSTGTGPELVLAEVLRQSGLPAFEMNVRGLPGTPDFVWRAERVAVFLNGCYWHRCEECALPPPGGPNAERWRLKFESNVRRHAAAVAALEADGWLVYTVWEHEVAAEFVGLVVGTVEAMVQAGAEAAHSGNGGGDVGDRP